MANREGDPIGTPVDQFVKEGKARHAILKMQRRVEKLNEHIAECRKEGYPVKLALQGSEGSETLSVAVVLPEGTENIRG